MAAKLTRLTHKTAIVAESCTICISRSRLPVRKILDTLSYVEAGVCVTVVLNLMSTGQAGSIYTIIAAARHIESKFSTLLSCHMLIIQEQHYTLFEKFRQQHVTSFLESCTVLVNFFTELNIALTVDPPPPHLHMCHI
jgi:hypothetical protein